MNRAQRRNQLTKKQIKEKQMSQRVESLPMKIHHGNSDTHVAVVFDRETKHILMTPAEAEAFIAAMQASIERVRAIAAKAATAIAPAEGAKCN